MTSALAAALLTCAIGAHAQPAAPQGPGQSMLVLDASGSMWGQIGGKPKIEIAREAVASMLGTWPASQQLGLMAYGHRSKGNCADIEMLKAPGALDKASFQQAVNALQPKGMTPISASVRMAAEQLKFSERKATVILVSDGEETCHADPCALGKELEKLGVDFTAHVVGFDIDKNPKAKAQLQCLASSTGGRYLDAKDAGELNKALREVAQAPAPAAAPRPKVAENLKPPKGCRLYDQDGFKGESVLIGELGYDNEMPPGWDNRVRSLKCSTRSGLYLYNDKGREGDYVMTGDGAEMTGLGAVASSYIYFGTFSEEEDVLEKKK
ncbi:MAG TPA: VWA domain-containing protein [Acidovorax sp.]|jgi:hypothetical protein|nr:VWA domain-containing protein [Acidovorax sp.]